MISSAKMVGLLSWLLKPAIFCCRKLLKRLPCVGLLHYLIKNKAMKNNFTNLKIVAGELRGREILSPANNSIHPMGSRERLALMNMLGPDIKDATLLDVFAGTGAIGIEALSRGAKQVVFVEKNHSVAQILRTNLANLKLTDRAKVIEQSVALIDFDDAFRSIYIK